jgi:hypothetical protein
MVVLCGHNDALLAARRPGRTRGLVLFCACMRERAYVYVCVRFVHCIDQKLTDFSKQKRIDDEIDQLMVDIRRIGDSGVPEVSFGLLFDDNGVQQFYESLAGTLKCAKKRGYIDYKADLLLKGVSDNVVISIKKEPSRH